MCFLDAQPIRFCVCIYLITLWERSQSQSLLLNVSDTRTAELRPFPPHANERQQEARLEIGSILRNGPQAFSYYPYTTVHHPSTAVFPSFKSLPSHNDITTHLDLFSLLFIF